MFVRQQFEWINRKIGKSTQSEKHQFQIVSARKSPQKNRPYWNQLKTVRIIKFDRYWTCGGGFLSYFLPIERVKKTRPRPINKHQIKRTSHIRLKKKLYSALYIKHWSKNWLHQSVFYQIISFITISSKHWVFEVFSTFALTIRTEQLVFSFIIVIPDLRSRAVINQSILSPLLPSPKVRAVIVRALHGARCLGTEDLSEIWNDDWLMSLAMLQKTM